jgi:uncharacterized membrane protein YfcA
MIDPAQLSPWLFVIAPLVIIGAYVVFGLSGFGSTVFAVPILAQLLPVSYLVPLMVVLDLSSAIFLGTTGRKDIARDELKSLLPWMFVGFAVGVTVLVGMPDRHLRAALGVFAAAVGVNAIVNPTLHRTISRAWSVPAGITGGAFATVFGAGGPIYATYLSGRLRGKGEIRSTISALISISAFSRAIIYAVSGLLLHATLLVGALALAPFAWIGLKIGNRIHIGLTQTQLRRAIGAVLVVSGVSLAIRAWVQ